MRVLTDKNGMLEMSRINVIFLTNVENCAIYGLTSLLVPLTPSLYLVSETHASPEFLDGLFLRPAVRHPHT